MARPVRCRSRRGQSELLSEIQERAEATHAARDAGVFCGGTQQGPQRSGVSGLVVS